MTTVAASAPAPAVPTSQASGRTATFTGPASQIPGLVGIGQDLWDIAKNYKRMASIGLMISEKGRGRVRADGEGNPAVSFQVASADAETLFKAFGRALRMAVEPDPRMAGQTPSTKGAL